jgi:hypothetical protein
MGRGNGERERVYRDAVSPQMTLCVLFSSLSPGPSPASGRGEECLEGLPDALVSRIMGSC